MTAYLDTHVAAFLHAGDPNLLSPAALHVGVVPDCETLAAAVFHAHRESWTRDPFDRIITAQAAVSGAVLLTRDERIRANYRQAVW